MKKIYTLISITFLVSCIKFFNSSEVIGTYTPVNYENNYDTLELKQNGIFHRKVYDINKKLLLEMNGKWHLETGRNLNLEGFYLNLDDDLVKFPEIVKDTSVLLETTIDIHDGRMQFCVGYLLDENCYQKIKN